MCYLKLIRINVLLLTLIAGSAASAVSTPDFTGYWTGELTYRGDALGVPLEGGQQRRLELLLLGSERFRRTRSGHH